MPDIEEQLRRQLRARGYDGATVAAVPTGGLPTAVYAVALGAGPGPGPRRLQGTTAELRDRIARLPRRPRAARWPSEGDEGGGDGRGAGRG